MMGVFVQTNTQSKRRNCQPVGYVIQENGCWEWIGGHTRHGYGSLVPPGGAPVLAHRHFYLLHKGQIPTGLQLDHLCRNRGCVNPDHLEAVTSRENSLRGANRAKTHCKRGHEFTEANTIRRVNHLGHPRRGCLTCSRAAARKAVEG